MRVLPRHLLPAFCLLLAPALSLAMEVASTESEQQAGSAPNTMASGSSADVPGQEAPAAPVESARDADAAANSDEPGTAGATTREQDEVTQTEAPAVGASPEAIAAPLVMPDHAPLRAVGGEVAERRRRVPLVIFNDFWGMARFTEADPVIHEKARSIAARATTSFWVNLSTSVAGFGLVGAAAVAPTCEARSEGPRCGPDMGLLLSGVGVGLVGALVATFISPKPKEFEELADAWNATIDEAIVPEPGLDPAGTDVPAPEAATP
jgi:hypothetical protein